MSTSAPGAVSLCIPAYEAAGFIQRTLDCARAQTHDDLRILVSVDRSEDDTADTCRRIAAEDPRIEVHVQGERLGWAGNVNFLLERAGETEFAFLYFHDDRIEPEYCERLVGALRASPDAASAHCALGHFGAGDHVIVARPYTGSATHRMVDFLTSPRKPSILRAMFRTALAGQLRLPTGAAGIWANQPFQMGLIAAGPALAVHDVLYRRWHRREGGLTESWRGMSFEEILAGYRANAIAAIDLIDALDASSAQREVLVFALMVQMTLRLRHAEESYGADGVHPPEAIHPAFAELEPPAGLADLPEGLRRQCEDVHTRVKRRTRKVERQVATV